MSIAGEATAIPCISKRVAGGSRAFLRTSMTPPTPVSATPSGRTLPP